VQALGSKALALNADALISVSPFTSIRSVCRAYMHTLRGMVLNLRILSHPEAFYNEKVTSTGRAGITMYPPRITMYCPLMARLFVVNGARL